MQNARLDEAQAGIKIERRNIDNLRCRWHHPYGRKQRGTKEPLDETERREWKSWLKTQHSKNEDHGIWSHHFMTNRWGKSGNSDGLFSWDSKSIANCNLIGNQNVWNFQSNSNLFGWLKCIFPSVIMRLLIRIHPLYIHYNLITKEENEGSKYIHLLFIMTHNKGRESLIAEG